MYESQKGEKMLKKRIEPRTEALLSHANSVKRLPGT